MAKGPKPSRPVGYVTHGRRKYDPPSDLPLVRPKGLPRPVYLKWNELVAKVGADHFRQSDYHLVHLAAKTLAALDEVEAQEGWMLDSGLARIRDVLAGRLNTTLKALGVSGNFHRDASMPTYHSNSRAELTENEARPEFDGEY